MKANSKTEKMDFLMVMPTCLQNLIMYWASLLPLLCVVVSIALSVSKTIDKKPFGKEMS